MKNSNKQGEYSEEIIQEFKYEVIDFVKSKIGGRMYDLKLAKIYSHQNSLLEIYSKKNKSDFHSALMLIINNENVNEDLLNNLLNDKKNNNNEK